MQIDFRNLFTPRLESGLSDADFQSNLGKLEEVKQKFSADKAAGKLAFVNILAESEHLQSILAETKSLSEGMETIVVVGIGGSDLGARAIFKALCHQYHNQMIAEDRMDGMGARKIFFIGDTTDPQPLKETFDVISPEKTLFLIVSKSGNTIEQASAFVYIRQQLIEKVGEAEMLRHILLLTDPATGTLRDLANKHGYKAISHPEVGGRFSVLSSVGMVPAMLMGLDVSKFLAGASDFAKKSETDSATEDLALKFAAAHYLYDTKFNKKIAVLMPYPYALKEFAFWYRQLWAESLGKREDLNGNIVYAGSTPIAALGPTDQHSQLQLYNEGPNDKVFTIILSEETKSETSLPDDYTGVEDFAYFKGHKFGELLNSEAATTTFALTKNNRPNCTITIPKLDEYNLGQLFYFYELAVTYLGYFYNVDAFNQPGVELSKNAMYGVLGKAGYEAQNAEFENYLKS